MAIAAVWIAIANDVFVMNGSLITGEVDATASSQAILDVVASIRGGRRWPLPRGQVALRSAPVGLDETED